VIQPGGLAADHQQVPHPATAHVASGLDRQVLDAADLGAVIREP